MSFLQPLVLAGLPLIALPILIHLVHQYRHRTVRWGAMMFLLRARRMNQGMARLRHLLIMLMRMAAVAALLFALSRPLASGWWSGLGLTKPDATLILLDRSASMETQDLQTGESKRSTAIEKLALRLGQSPPVGGLVLIDSASGEARTLDSARALTELPFTAATATRADIPGMLERALAYLKAHDAGRADVWICSDLRARDWDAGNGRWAAIREQLRQCKGARVLLLAYPEQPAHNLTVRVTNVKRRPRGSEAELILDVTIGADRPSAHMGGGEPRVAVEFEVNRVRSVVELPLDAWGASLQGHRIPIDRELRSGWGSVTLPGDANLLDNRFYFVFCEPPVRQATIVAEDVRTGEALRRALAIPTEPGVEHRAEALPVARAGELDWERTGLIVWQAPLPQGPLAAQFERFVDSDRVALFFPPLERDGGTLFASRWGAWQAAGPEAAKVAWWRGETDLLAHAGSGEPLPLDELRSYRTCDLESAGTILARLDRDRPLLTRVPTDRGGVYFCSTLPTASYSSLERDGVVFYALLQRALADGSRALALASQREAGPEALAGRTHWDSVAPLEGAATLSQRGLLPGVYRSGEYWIAVNRSEAEDEATVLGAATVDGLFQGLSYERIEDEVGGRSPLARELWRAFLLAMMLALMLEAVLCLPARRVEPRRAGGFAPAGSGRG